MEIWIKQGVFYGQSRKNMVTILVGQIYLFWLEILLTRVWGLKCLDFLMEEQIYGTLKKIFIGDLKKNF